MVEKTVEDASFVDGSFRIRIRRCGGSSNRQHNQVVLTEADDRREMCCKDHNFFAGNPLD
jgi:hypothetical protein